MAQFPGVYIEELPSRPPIPPAAMEVWVSAPALARHIADALAWTVFEPNGPALWAAVRDTVDAFLRPAHQARVFVGRTPDDAYFVRCEATAADLASGHARVTLGFAYRHPAEFETARILLTTGSAA